MTSQSAHVNAICPFEYGITHPGAITFRTQLIVPLQDDATLSILSTTPMILGNESQAAPGYGALTTDPIVTSLPDIE
jgi:hypothetical protein